MSLQSIYERLNFKPENGLFLTEDQNWQKESQLPKQLCLSIEKINPVAFFCFKESPLILFFDSPRNEEELYKKIWNFNASPIIIINKGETVEIYNGFSYLKKDKKLKKLGGMEELDHFSYFKLVTGKSSKDTGKSLKDYEQEFKKENRVDYWLLENIHTARKNLIQRCDIGSELANALIGKCIFVRYLIDRKVKIKFEGEKKLWTNDDFCRLLKKQKKVIDFFQYLQEKFNGDAFLIDNEKLQEIHSDAFTILGNLLKGDEMSSGQRALFDIYDFSIIPVEFISNVYEDFIGKEQQAEKGAYYTPKFLVDYILKETVEKHLEKNPTCKVLDPACGSGIFLVQALRLIIEKYEDLHKEKIKQIEQDKKIENKKFNQKLREIAEENIYGIDQDEKAVDVAIFSVYLTLLDHQDPKDIENFKFPELKESNFYTADFFNKKAKYNTNFKKINFDFILGNPPWGRGLSRGLPKEYIDDRKKDDRKKKETHQDNNAPEIAISNKEIAQPFLIRTSDFSSQTTKCALIVTSKVLYNLQANKFRKYFLHNFFIKQVFELAPVKTEVFASAKAPATILFFEYAHQKDTSKNTILHLCLKPNRLFSLFKIFVLQRPDIKKVAQKRLMEYDWLWKVLVYGSYLDFNFLKYLKNEYKPFEEIIEKKNFVRGEGIIVGKNGTYDAKDYIGKPFITTQQFSPFFINYNKNSQWKCEFVHRIRNKDLFKKPALLIIRSVNRNFQAKAAILYNDAIFKHAFTAIKTEKGDVDCLRIANGIMCSKIFSYFVLLRASCIGIERDQLHDEEKFNFPYIKNSKIAEIVKQIEARTKEFFQKQKNSLNLQTQDLENENLINDLNNDLNKEIFKTFKLYEQELTLIDYATKITIPIIKKHRGYEELFSSIPFKDKSLEIYANVFLARFKNSFTQKHLEVDIWHSEYIVGMFFEVVPDDNENKKKIQWSTKDNNIFLQNISELGIEKISEKLFIQKDIRGFETNSFYIIKPNEKKLWHKAIAYLDVNEFVDAMFRSGKKSYNE